MGKLIHIAHRLRRRLFDSRRRAVSDSESFATPLCQSPLQIQDLPLLVFAGEYLAPYQITFEVQARTKAPGSYLISDSNRHAFVELRIRNDLLCPEIREVWSQDGKRRIAFACRKRWSKHWCLYLPSGAPICDLIANPSGYTVLLHGSKEVLSIQTHCNCGGPCFNFHRGDSHLAGRTVAMAIPKPDRSGFQIVVAPFVDVMLVIAISSCVWKMS